MTEPEKPRPLSRFPKCEICGIDKDLEVHHIKPLSKGGTDIPENKVLLCKKCHNNRHKTNPHSGSQGLYSYHRNTSPVATFYISGFEEQWQRFREICVREGLTASKKVKEFIAEYVRLHEPGNPQQRIDVILFNKKAYKTPKFCEVRGCNGQASGFGVYQGKQYVLCKAHIHVFAGSKAWKIE